MNCQTWVMTGNFQYLNKEIVSTVLADIGHNLESRLTGKTDFVLCGFNPGSKLAMAQFSGIAIITEQQFLGLLGIEI